VFVVAAPTQRQQVTQVVGASRTAIYHMVGVQRSTAPAMAAPKFVTGVAGNDLSY
jgi:hypothetical protein